MIEAAPREANLVMLPVWAIGGYVLGRVLAMGHERFDAWRMARHRERQLRDERFDAWRMARHRERQLRDERAVARWERAVLHEIDDYHNTRLPMATYADALRDALKADAELRRGQSERSTQWQSCSVTITNGPGGTKVRQSYDASGNPVPSFTLEDFMHLQPAPPPARAEIPPPPPGTPFDWRADPRFEPTRAQMSEAELAALPAPIANTGDAAQKMRAAKFAHDATQRARAPHQWRCDKCGYTETLTDDEVALRADGVGDLWAAHWPAKAQGDAADILCDGRVIRLGSAR